MEDKIMFSPVKNGQYTVKMDLNAPLMDDCQQCGFEKQLAEIYHYEKEYAFVSVLKNGILKYKSETLLPNNMDDRGKQKLLFIIGNPANHSVINAMFFFSKQDGSRHGMWKKLAIAGVIKNFESKKNIPIDARKEEAKTRKKNLLDGATSNQYLVGLTTFYSFPTSADGGVQRVKQLFAPIINELNQKEVERILKYEFTKGAKLIFVQRSSYDAFQSAPESTDQDTLFWPIRGKGSSGENLKKLLKLDVTKMTKK